MSENNDTRIGRLEIQLSEQQEINKRNTDLLAEIAQGLKAIRDGNAAGFQETRSYERMTKVPNDRLYPERITGATIAPKGFKSARATIERGNVIGVCMWCSAPVRRPPKELLAVCPRCCELHDENIFYGRLCADCPHVEGAHRKGAACAPPCTCVSFRLRENAQIETDERQAMLAFLRNSGDLVSTERLIRIRESVPAIVFYRGAQERLEELKKENKLNGHEALVLGRQMNVAYLEVSQELRALAMTKKIALKEATPREEYATYTTKLGILMARQAGQNTAEIHELTRKAGEAWSRMSSAEKQATKEEFQKYAYLAEGFAPPLDDDGNEQLNVEVSIVPEDVVEKLPPLDPNRMRPVVLENRDEERADLKVVFSITRSQAAILEWGLAHPQVMGVKEHFEIIEDLAGAMLLPSFSYMLKHIAVARGQNTDETKPGPGRDS